MYITYLFGWKISGLQVGFFVVFCLAKLYWPFLWNVGPCCLWYKGMKASSKEKSIFA